jgi:peptidoglycan/xylan/chitin deacetylase (PgdA/CDA1 family)/glycosyltransferase involved in cell wall biosynthesis
MFVTLLYHHVDSRLRTDIAISETAFGEQLAHLRREGYPVLTLEEVLRTASGEAMPPERAVFLTLDDGYADNLQLALPRLRAQGMEATMFVPTAHVGCSNAWNTRVTYEARHLDWHELEEWIEGGGKIGGHTHAHESAEEVDAPLYRDSVQLNRRSLERRLGIEVVAFAYPYGHVTPEARAAVSDEYEIAWVVRGGTWDPQRDPFMLNRHVIGPHLRIRDFAYELEGLFDEMATGKSFWRPRAKNPSARPRRPVARSHRPIAGPAPGSPRVAIVSAGEEDELGPAPADRFADLLANGWDAHLVHLGDAFAQPGLDDLPDEVLRRRVHPPPRELRYRRPRPELVGGLVSTLRRQPRAAVPELLRRVDLAARYARGVLLALRPQLVCLPPEACGGGWPELVRLTGSRSITREAVAALGPVLDRSLLDWPAPNGNGQALRVLTVGRLGWQEGLEHLLDAIRLLREDGVGCTCRIVGAGEYEDAVTFARHQLGMGEAVEVFPTAGREGLLEHLRWADIVVNPAVVPARPRWWLDACAAGRGLVTTPFPGGDQAGAVVVPRRDPDTLAEALATLARDGGLRAELGEQGRRHALQAGEEVESNFAAFRELCRRALDG